MNPKGSLRFKLAIGFITITFPLVCLLIYSNFTASNSVREQAAESNKNMISLYSNQIQTSLGIEANFLYDMTSHDADILSLNKMVYNSSDYTLTKMRILNSLSRYNRFDNSIDIQFAYSKVYRDLIHTSIKADSYEEAIVIKQCIQGILDMAQPESPLFRGWKTVSCGDIYGLVRIVDSGFGVYLGAWVQLNHLMIPLELIQLGGEGFSALANPEGRLIAGSFEIGGFKDPPRINSDARYQRLKGENGTYVVVSNPIKSTDVTLIAFIPEQGMLDNISRFREVIAWIPLFAFLLLLLYLIYLNSIILRPMNALLKGMRTLKRGDWAIRLNNSPSREFHAVTETFNDMAHQIQELKINVYEEQIRTHKAELKHLQLQINPHFLLNSINVIYNLAQLKNYTVIQAMCLNLVKYFRFTTKTSQPFVRLSEEMEHMDSYLCIQQLRFPGRITFEIVIDENAKQVPIPPLIVQPFIENAIKYGFDFMEEPFHIEIQATLDTDQRFCRIRIVDNGCGFSPEMLESLQSGRYFHQTNDQHLGIWNSYHRLQLLYGNTARLNFDNCLNSGALIELDVPIEVSS
ncbi:HAMP domain-containing protein [Paenibacillus anaericanus]|uniref:HAMP domain-containing protein n=1 Tax=Paenibacillus anaericanus TaxID=170367 RepID=A0A3S1C7R1_9BACL|nr:histidine kinase [Paenibacillus anaericanus]RUT45301.1 HAMP domain-containing protein [Paenibacillus anaericanus]